MVISVGASTSLASTSLVPAALVAADRLKSSLPQSTDTLASATTTTNAPVPEVTITSGAIGSTHPYYFHPSDYLGMNFVSLTFDGKGYGGWRRAVIIALSAKIKLGFIDDTLVVLKADSGIQQAWARCNAMVLSWLLNSLSKEIADSVLYSQSAKDLWNGLEDRFGQANGVKLFQLQKELSSAVQGNSSVSTYFTKMKSLWDELDALNTFSAYICEYEKQGEIHATPAYLGEPTSFIVANQPGNFRKFNENRMQKISFESKKNTGIFSYSKKPGHSIDKCYRIHGFPADSKFTKKKRFQGGARANNAFFSNEESEDGAENATGV
uniref:Retrotransposon Copia-like N-terminal domain-containing protein n=1 Tax=Nicotiana tabacum TaxID=4097 RepID=A0A1S3YGR5_TOBAC|nr:PREDICTED: uncharacterized protein LOC107776029 [Nicotiana tabacum]